MALGEIPSTPDDSALFAALDSMPMMRRLSARTRHLRRDEVLRAAAVHGHRARHRLPVRAGRACSANVLALAAALAALLPLAAAALAPRLEVDARIRQADGTVRQISIAPGAVLSTGDEVRLRVTPWTDGYLYVVALGSSGAAVVLHPFTGPAVPVKAGEPVAVPPDGGFLPLDGRTGRETLMAFVSESPLESVSRLLVLMEARADDPAAARAVLVAEGLEVAHLGFGHRPEPVPAAPAAAGKGAAAEAPAPGATYREEGVLSGAGSRIPRFSGKQGAQAPPEAPAPADAAPPAAPAAVPSPEGAAPAAVPPSSPPATPPAVPGGQSSSGGIVSGLASLFGFGTRDDAAPAAAARDDMPQPPAATFPLASTPGPIAPSHLAAREAHTGAPAAETFAAAPVRAGSAAAESPVVASDVPAPVSTAEREGPRSSSPAATAPATPAPVADAATSDGAAVTVSPSRRRTLLDEPLWVEALPPPAAGPAASEASTGPDLGVARGSVGEAPDRASPGSGLFSGLSRLFGGGERSDGVPPSPRQSGESQTGTATPAVDVATPPRAAPVSVERTPATTPNPSSVADAALSRSGDPSPAGARTGATAWPPPTWRGDAIPPPPPLATGPAADEGLAAADSRPPPSESRAADAGRAASEPGSGAPPAIAIAPAPAPREETLYRALPDGEVPPTQRTRLAPVELRTAPGSGDAAAGQGVVEVLSAQGTRLPPVEDRSVPAGGGAAGLHNAAAAISAEGTRLPAVEGRSMPGREGAMVEQPPGGEVLSAERSRLPSVEDRTVPGREGAMVEQPPGGEVRSAERIRLPPVESRTAPGREGAVMEQPPGGEARSAERIRLPRVEGRTAPGREGATVGQPPGGEVRSAERIRLPPVEDRTAPGRGDAAAEQGGGLLSALGTLFGGTHGDGGDAAAGVAGAGEAPLPDRPRERAAERSATEEVRATGAPVTDSPSGNAAVSERQARVTPPAPAAEAGPQRTDAAPPAAMPAAAETSGGVEAERTTVDEPSGFLAALGSIFGGGSKDSTVDPRLETPDTGPAAVSEPARTERAPPAASPPPGPTPRDPASDVVVASPVQEGRASPEVAAGSGQDREKAEDRGTASGGFFARLGSIFSGGSSEAPAPGAEQPARMADAPEPEPRVRSVTEPTVSRRVDPSGRNVVLLEGTPTPERGQSGVLSAAGSRIRALLDEPEPEPPTPAPPSPAPRQGAAAAAAATAVIPAPAASPPVAAVVTPDPVQTTLAARGGAAALSPPGHQVALLTAAPPAAPVAAAEPLAEVDLASNRGAAGAVVMVVSPEGATGGVLVDDTGHVLTNWHSVQGYDAVVVVFKAAGGNGPAAGTGARARVVAHSKFADLALLRVEEPPAGIAAPALVAQVEVDSGAPIHAIGPGEDGRWRHTVATVDRIRRNSSWYSSRRVLHRADVVRAEMTAARELVGAPLFNNRLELVGLGAMVRSDKGELIGVTAGTIRAFLAGSG